MELATCSYTAYREVMGLAVRTSTGYPRWWRGPKLEYAPACAPFGIFGVVTDRMEFARHYLDRLDLYAGEIATELVAIARAHADRRLVLLCFENLSKPGTWCHRRLLSAWLEEHTGLDIPELGPLPRPVPTDRVATGPTQGTLL